MYVATITHLAENTAAADDASQTTFIGTIKDVLAIPALAAGAVASLYIVPKARLDNRKTEIDERKAILDARKTRLEILEKERQLGIAEGGPDTSPSNAGDLRREAESLEIADEVLVNSSIQTVVAKFVLLYLLLEFWYLFGRVFNSGENFARSIWTKLLFDAIPGAVQAVLIVLVGLPIFTDLLQILGYSVAPFVRSKKFRALILIIAIAAAITSSGSLLFTL